MKPVRQIKEIHFEAESGSFIKTVSIDLSWSFIVKCEVFEQNFAKDRKAVTYKIFSDIPRRPIGKPTLKVRVSGSLLKENPFEAENHSEINYKEAYDEDSINEFGKKIRAKDLAEQVILEKYQGFKII